MNKVDPPDYCDDDHALDALVLNTRLKAHPVLGPQVPAIKSAYAQYIAVSGNAHRVANTALPEALEAGLRALYESPSKELNHIKRIRKDGADCCPMCGSFHTGTLDHLLPKADYPVFAIFSRNLVPACLCNNLRGNRLTGGATERILHPYFDDVLLERLLSAHFEDLGEAPRITLRPLLDRAHPQAAAVLFHIANVVERTPILRYLQKSWAGMLRRPSIVAAELRAPPSSRQALKDTIAEELKRHDDTHGSQNNWRSIFLKGLLDDPVLDWMFSALTRPGYHPDDPLINGIV